MWTDVFTHFRVDNTQLINMEIVEFAMVISASSVEVERLLKCPGILPKSHGSTGGYYLLHC